MTACCSDWVPASTGAAAVTSMPAGSIGVSRSGRSSSTGALVDQVDVEVLGPRLGARRQGQPEVQLGPGREPLRVHERDVGPAERPLPDAGEVAVAREADLAELGEAQPHPHQEPADAPAMGRAVMATGTAPPVERSWPVPWLPPAGGTAEATTCSMPKPVQAPQS